MNNTTNFKCEKIDGKLIKRRKKRNLVAKNKILVISKNINSAIVVRLLFTSNVQVEHVATKNEGLKKLKNSREFSLAILEYDTPKTDCLTFLNSYEKALINTPIIICLPNQPIGKSIIDKLHTYASVKNIIGPIIDDDMLKNTFEKGLSLIKK